MRFWEMLATRKPRKRTTRHTNESAQHRRAKQKIHLALKRHPGVEWVEVEKVLPDRQRPDILFKPAGKSRQIAIELQKSILTREDIIERTARYHENDIAVLWLVVGTAPRNGHETQVHGWIRALHSIYYGKVFYFGGISRGRHRAPIALHYELEPVTRWVPENRYGGGYHKTLKKTRAFKKRGRLNVVADMQYVLRHQWREYPDAYLWTVT